MILGDTQIVTLQWLEGLDEVLKELPNALLVHEGHKVLENSAQILVEDHSQCET